METTVKGGEEWKTGDAWWLVQDTSGVIQQGQGGLSEVYVCKCTDPGNWAGRTRVPAAVTELRYCNSLWHWSLMQLECSNRGIQAFKQREAWKTGRGGCCLLRMFCRVFDTCAFCMCFLHVLSAKQQAAALYQLLPNFPRWFHLSI